MTPENLQTSIYIGGLNDTSCASCYLDSLPDSYYVPPMS